MEFKAIQETSTSRKRCEIESTTPSTRQTRLSNRKGQPTDLYSNNNLDDDEVVSSEVDGDTSGDYPPDSNFGVNSQRDSISNFNNAMAVLFKEQNNLLELNKAVRRKRADDRKDTQKVRDKNKALTELVVGLKKRVETLEKKIEEMELSHKNTLMEKENSFAKMEKEIMSRYPVKEIIPDNVIRERLFLIQTEIMNWCKTWVSTNFHASNPQSSTYVLRLGVIDRSPENLDRLRKLFLNWKSGDRVLLTTKLTDIMMEVFFRRSFSFLSTGLTATDIELECDHLYKCLRNGSVHQAESWRAETVDTFITHVMKHRQSKIVSEGQGTAQPPHDCNRLASQTIGQIKAMLKEVSREAQDRRFKELYSIFMHASLLAGQLWAQKTAISVNISDVFQTPFTSKSTLTIPHKTMGLEDDDTSYDDSKVDFVMFPPIYAHGNSEGKNYEQKRVWLKAIVKIFDPVPHLRADDVEVVGHRKRIEEQPLISQVTTQPPKDSVEPYPTAKKLKTAHEYQTPPLQQAPEEHKNHRCDFSKSLNEIQALSKNLTKAIDQAVVSSTTQNLSES